MGKKFYVGKDELTEFDFVEVTEECAKSIFYALGNGDAQEIDKIAVSVIRDKLNEINFSGHVVLCEGKKDNSYELQGERVGKLNIPVIDVDLACDPVDGSTRSSNLQSDACSILVLASKDSLHIPQTFYMKKLITRSELYDSFNTDLLHLPIKKISKRLSQALRRKPIVCLLNRDRNSDFINEFRKSGCRIKLIDDCDVLGGLEVFNNIDLYYGIGGGPETILVTSAVKAFGGRIEAQSVDSNWVVTGPVMKNDDLIKGYSVFIATGITDSNMLKGVKFKNGKIVTETIFTSDEEEGTIRKITTEHEP